jgi:hypothetical protein
MTLREVLSLGVQRITVTPTESGCDKTFHYFTIRYGKQPSIMTLMFDADESGDYYMTLFDYEQKWYNYDDAVKLMTLISKAQ